MLSLQWWTWEGQKVYFFTSINVLVLLVLLHWNNETTTISLFHSGYSTVENPDAPQSDKAGLYCSQWDVYSDA